MSSEESSIKQFNDLSTQTDFSPRLSSSTFRKLDRIRRESSNLDSLVAILTDCSSKNDQVRLNKESMVKGLQKKKRDVKSQLKALVDSKGRNLILSSSANPDDIDLVEIIESLRRNDNLPRTYTIEELVGSTALLSSKNYSELSTDSDKVNFRHCSSQTEISTLLIGLDFGDVLPTDNLQQTVSKLNGQWVCCNDCISKLNYETRRLQWHCQNLNAGQGITVFENDLLFEEEHTRIARYQSLINEINNQAKIISDKHMLKRVNTADALYALDLKLDLPVARYINEDDYERLQKKAFKLEVILKKIEEHEKELERRKIVQSEPEYKRIAAVLNEKRAEINQLESLIFSLESQLGETNRAMAETKRENIKLQNKVSNLRRVNDDRLRNQAKKFSKNEIKKLKTKITKLEALVGKYKWDGTSEKSSSEYEMILGEKDSRIAEYLSVLDSNRLKFIKIVFSTAVDLLS